jgi:hypothetical protein
MKKTNHTCYITVGEGGDELNFWGARATPARLLHPLNSRRRASDFKIVLRIMNFIAQKHSQPHTIQ